MKIKKLNIIVTGPLNDQQRDFIVSLESIRRVEKVTHVSTGEETINLYGKIKPDIIFIDIIMSGMTGIETARWIKEQDKRIKIILFSGDFNKEFAFAGMKDKLNGYIKKTNDPIILKHLIKEVLAEQAYFIISDN